MDIKLHIGDEEAGGKRLFTFEGHGLSGVVEVDTAVVLGNKSLGYLIRQIGDALMLAQPGDKTIDPVGIRERRDLLRTRAPRRRR